MSQANQLRDRSVDQLPALRRYARTLVGEQQADDLVQEALLRAYAAHDQFRHDGSLRTWLLSILHNCFVSSWRREKIETAALAELGMQLPLLQRASQEDALHLSDLSRAIGRLSPDHRAVLHLVTVESLSYEAVADVLGIPAGTVMSRLSRARAALRTSLSAQAQPLRVVGGSDGPAR